MLEVQITYFINFAQFLLQSTLYFTFCHSILVLYYIGIIFSKNIFLFLGRVPTTAYLIAQHTSYGHRMNLYGESAITKAGIIWQ